MKEFEIKIIEENVHEASKLDYEAVARALLPSFRDYLLSEQGQEDFAEWNKLHSA